MVRKNICNTCESIIFNYRDTDCYGNIVHSSRCLNGHIKELHIENFYDTKEKKSYEIFGSKEDIVAYLGIHIP